MRIIGYAYEADFHCIECTFLRFDVPFDSELGLVHDNEGNTVHPVLDIDVQGAEYCGNCSEILI